MPATVVAHTSCLTGLVVAGVMLALTGVGHVDAQTSPAPVARAETVRRYAAPEARQAVAVDASHFYAITNREIAKYDRTTGARVAHWRGADDGPFIHLNSGVVIDGRLYCAHSNYPGLPMVSSVEVFDTQSLQPVGSIPLGIAQGSATYVDRFDDAWWVGYAHYAGRGGEPGRGSEYTTLVRYDDEWRQTGAFAFPAEVVAQWDGMSSSGGFWRRSDGLLYTTPHHTPVLHVLRRPSAGARLELVRTISIESEGQGIALDPTDASLIWSIQRRTGEVLVSRLPW